MTVMYTINIESCGCTRAEARCACVVVISWILAAIMSGWMLIKRARVLAAVLLSFRVSGSSSYIYSYCSEDESRSRSWSFQQSSASLQRVLSTGAECYCWCGHEWWHWTRHAFLRRVHEQSNHKWYVSQTKYSVTTVYNMFCLQSLAGCICCSSMIIFFSPLLNTVTVFNI